MSQKRRPSRGGNLGPIGNGMVVKFGNLAGGWTIGTGGDAFASIGGGEILVARPAAARHSQDRHQ